MTSRPPSPPKNRGAQVIAIGALFVIVGAVLALVMIQRGSKKPAAPPAPRVEETGDPFEDLSLDPLDPANQSPPEIAAPADPASTEPSRGEKSDAE